ncbi:MAG TPA: hypothetical protein HA362_02505 [Nanoarchaeota archaeon]|nr:hypothetical protein [Nanoarchaeota archaeon]
MGFQDAYEAYVLTGANAGITTEEVGRAFMDKYLQDKQGTEMERTARAHASLDDAFRACGPVSAGLQGILNIKCFTLCNDLLRQETGRK